MEKYDRIRCHGPRGKRDKTGFYASYLHPIFLEKARAYIRAVDERIRPFLATNGGCIVSVQADNEIGGIHVWRGFLDCNREAMGIGYADGRYVRFLADKYGDVETLNERYGSAYASLCDILPYENTPPESEIGGKRFASDYHDFYRGVLEEYIRILCTWFREDGIDVDVCVNAGTPSLIPIMRNIPEQNRDSRLFVGVDHYYALTPSAGISMTPDKAMRYMRSLDMLSGLGMPPSVLEMQSGSASCYPPILPGNLKGFYMNHVAFGMKGSNYYVFTGGPNFENTGANTEIYDYHAPVSATGEIRPIYYAQKERNDYTNENEWLLTRERVSDLQLGFTWELADKMLTGLKNRNSANGVNARDYSESVALTLCLGGGMPRWVELGGRLDSEKPLLVFSDERMPREKQERLIEFVRSGGRLLITPTVPEYDEDFLPCTLLKSFLGVEAITPLESAESITRDNGVKVYGIDKRFSFEGFAGRALATDDKSGDAIAEYKEIGKGAVVLLGATYGYSQFCQMDMLFDMLGLLGYERRADTGSRNLFITLFEREEGATCFLINNLADSLDASPTVRANGKEYSLGTLTVPAMSVLPIDLK